MKKRVLILILSIALFYFPVYSDGKEITVEDIINTETVSDFQFSPDGKLVVWVQRSANKGKDTHLSYIWMANLELGGEPIQITRGDYSCWSPRFSPDGKKIAFLSDRAEKSQIYLINPFGGEAEKLTDVKMGVNSFEWKENETIIYSAREDEYFFEKERKEKKDDAEVFEDMETFFPVRLFSISLKDKKVLRLTENKDRITEFAISPDGKFALTTHIDTPRYEVEAKHRPKYFLWDLESNKFKQIFTKDKYFSPAFYKWSDDSKELYLVEEKTRYEDKRASGIKLLYTYDPGKDLIEEIPLNWKNGIGGIYGKLFDSAKNIIITSHAKGVVNPLVILEKINGSWKLTKIQHEHSANISAYALSKDSKSIVYVYSTAEKLPKIYYASIENGTFKDLKVLAELNKHLKEKFIARREIVRWKSKGGREIEGILFYPKDYKEGKKYPLLLNIHGGPAAYDPDLFELTWGSYPHLIAEKGGFVLMVNYSGSSNYGLYHVESIYGRYYELEVPDIISGVDYLIKRGLVDPERIGTQGWSNGSILSIALTVEYPERIKVALCGAGDVNWISDYGNCMFGPQFDDLYLGDSFFKKLDLYIKKSPLFKMDKVITPTLILFGDKDKNVPTEQGFEHYRALQLLGKAPVRFVIFPGEPHGLRRLSHQRRKIEEELAWLEKYFFKKEEKRIKSLKEGSPLDIALKKDIKKDERGFYGVKINEILCPETVEKGDIEIGKFEVTRAQFSEFLSQNRDVDTKNLIGFKDGKFEPGKENLPVSGIDLETAKKYCEWLSSRTGLKFRLPTEKEMDEWLKKASGEENTLCYWAGYDLSIDEAEELEEKINELESKSGLILPVGSFPPSFENIYDINGNLAEWCTVEGKEDGKVKGLYARSICDKKSIYKVPPEKYIGFRVVVEKKK
ncbi:MAG: S9 family peptidase [Candidatus Aminicenantia bacterium]